MTVKELRDFLSRGFDDDALVQIQSYESKERKLVDIAFIYDDTHIEIVEDTESEEEQE